MNQFTWDPEDLTMIGAVSKKKSKLGRSGRSPDGKVSSPATVKSKSVRAKGQKSLTGSESDKK